MAVGGRRRFFGYLAAAGALVEALYLAWLAGSYAQDDPMDVEFVAFLAGCAAFFGLVTVLAWRAARGRGIHWATRALFLLLTPVVLFLLLASFGFWGEARWWTDYALAAAYTVSELAMLLGFPVLALSRRTRTRPHPTADEGRPAGRASPQEGAQAEAR